MASLYLCSHPTKTRQTQSKLPRMAASTPHVSNIAAPFNLRSSKLCTLDIQSLHQRSPCIINHNDKYFHSSVSSPTVKQENPLTIGIIGLGEFGQFLAKAFQRQGHTVIGTSRSDYSEYCREHDIQFFPHLDDLCDAKPDVVLVCNSILSTEDVVRKIPFHKLKPDTIIADVLSVKQFPKNLLLDVVPSGFGILCTHPMFGKFSGKNSWEGLRFVYEKVRVRNNSNQEKNCDKFLNIFQDEGCRMVEMSCEEHDKYAAESQFVTHTIANILNSMNLDSTPIDTKGYETLMELTRNTVSHGSDLYDGLFLHNVNAAKQIENLERAFDKVKQNLFGKLRDSSRRGIEETTPIANPIVSVQLPKFLPVSGKVLKDVSSFSTVAKQETKMN